MHPTPFCGKKSHQKLSNTLKDRERQYSSPADTPPATTAMVAGGGRVAKGHSVIKRKSHRPRGYKAMLLIIKYILTIPAIN